MSSPWLQVVGLGEDGLDGLSPRARALVDSAEVLVGGARHLAKVPKDKAERVPWGADFAATVDSLVRFRGRRVVVLASGDPMNYGAGSIVARHFARDEFAIHPGPSAFSLAAARLGWPLPDLDCLTVHGRPLAVVDRHLAPGRRLLVLAEDGETPAKLAAHLVARGYGRSPIFALERLGGADERVIEGTADSWAHPRGDDLVTLAVECVAGPRARVLSRAPGLPDEAFAHDGQITKREVRAATLARLMPLPGQLLWDVGAGAGSVAIEWLRAEPQARAVALEREPSRLELIRRNAADLGVPELKIVAGEAPLALGELPAPPDAVFVGGGISAEILAKCWDALAPFGRLVANAVTLEAERALLDFHAREGGELTRIGIERVEALGGHAALKPMRPVLQLAVLKP
ncbi:MAG: precorrin-6y C5,15-methyltransferase (decarboxylating) subunit CbiE [Rhodospirillales bacterium]|nr:precorrin-6y C5,15-methyltransferase (decarboxylating) subunit CbiE [Rhodospirillales bacterium]